MVAASSSVVAVYPLSSYTFGTKEPKLEKDTSVADRLARMKVNVAPPQDRELVFSHVVPLFTNFSWFLNYELIKEVQEHNHPHILLLQIGNTFCKLPGGRLKPGENEIDGLKRKLSSKLGANSTAHQPNWQIGECVANWWRPNFETVMYPYCPPHITKPKECKKLFMVHLPEREYFAVPKNLKLLAVPLFELYDNVQRYGPVISTIPQQLSRFQFNMISP
uniref:Pre-mRNA cleavage factor Im 25 kDa subunit n=1 Tax=Chenopodium quinoa TaxID=63459 RepID=A0A803KZ63_CHEQI